ncbi:GNAT family N-acetyltransferase [Halomicroarcula sp. GCM10025709]|uniref:GNAT family N-acetyltransferase n=1 Tax=Haloarcula TaxID=2237 RepID=UPI0024C359A7|nr:GNAT family N-acetyltransferase [Halomicroarcula sp. YJ-61-S]
MGAVQFRQYGSADAQAVWDLHEWAMRAAGTEPADIPGTDDLRDIDGRYLDTGGEFLVGLLTEDGPADADAVGSDLPRTTDGAVAAIGGYLPNEVGHADERTVPGAAELHRMRVAPPCQRRGIGRDLLHRLEARAAEDGFELLLATTARRQAAAVEFYRDEGYDCVGESMEGEYELVHFEKRL